MIKSEVGGFIALLPGSGLSFDSHPNRMLGDSTSLAAQLTESI